MNRLRGRCTFDPGPDLDNANVGRECEQIYRSWCICSFCMKRTAGTAGGYDAGKGAGKMNCNQKDLLLYAVTDRAWLGDGTLTGQVEQAILGGVSFVQLREKTLPHDAFLAEAIRMKALCGRYGVPLVINDSAEIALASGADGVHVGQHDMGVREARKMLGPDKIIGASARTVEQALLAEQNGADYLGVGAAFPTGSKADAVEVSHGTIRAICQAVRIPVVAIGGICAENVRQLAGLGVCGVAVISAIFAKADVRRAAVELRASVEAMLAE